MGQAKHKLYQLPGACSRKAVYQQCFIWQTPNSSRPSGRERNAAA